MSRFASLCPALIALLALTAPSPAAAQTSAALMPSTGGHREIPDSVREEATRAALEYLRTEDLAVLAPPSSSRCSTRRSAPAPRTPTA
ncbi:MAG: hypothetical protein RLO54_02260 [Sandaracinaceae bacterium]